jgi:hypothetical protein
MFELLRSLAEGILIPVITASAARYWKSSSKPMQETGEDKLLAFEFLLAGITILALTVIRTMRALLRPEWSGDRLYFLYEGDFLFPARPLVLLLVMQLILGGVLIAIMMISAHWVKNHGWQREQDASLHRSSGTEPVWELPSAVALAVNWRAAWVLASTWLIASFLPPLAYTLWR